MIIKLNRNLTTKNLLIKSRKEEIAIKNWIGVQLDQPIKLPNHNINIAEMMLTCDYCINQLLKNKGILLIMIHLIMKQEIQLNKCIITSLE